MRFCPRRFPVGGCASTTGISARSKEGVAFLVACCVAPQVSLFILSAGSIAVPPMKHCIMVFGKDLCEVYSNVQVCPLRLAGLGGHHNENFGAMGFRNPPLSCNGNGLGE